MSSEPGLWSEPRLGRAARWSTWSNDCWELVLRVMESMMERPLETEKEWAGELIFGGRRSLWLGRGLEKLFLDRPGSFGLPDGAGYGGSGGCFGFAFRGGAVHDRVPLLDGGLRYGVLRGGWAGRGGSTRGVPLG